MIRFRIHEPAPELDEVLGHAVKGSASLILLISRESLASYWVQREVTLALEHHRKIVGVVIDADVAGTLPDWLASAVRTDELYGLTAWRDSRPFDDCVRRLTENVFGMRHTSDNA